MSINHTPTLHLNTWEDVERFSRTEFNENFAAIDAGVAANAAALYTLTPRVASAESAASANAAGLAALTPRVAAVESAASTAQSAAAANAAANTALAARVTALETAAQGAAGNTKLVWGVYTGNGGYGSSDPSTLTFDGMPLEVTLRYNYSGTLYERKLTWPQTNYMGSYTNPTFFAAWGANSLSWYTSEGALQQFNLADTEYIYIALIGT